MFQKMSMNPHFSWKMSQVTMIISSPLQQAFAYKKCAITMKRTSGLTVPYWSSCFAAAAADRKKSMNHGSRTMKNILKSSQAPKRGFSSAPMKKSYRR